MALSHKRVFVAAAAGFSFSAVLAVLEATRHLDVLMILQLPGFLFGAFIWGVHSGGNSFEVVLVLVNGVIYSALLLIAVRVVIRLKHKL